MENNENKSICSICGGKCCKRMPGLNIPDDFNNDIRLIFKALKSGKYCIDWWEDSPNIYYVRPATADKIGFLKDPSWGGTCNFLTANGCSLKFEERPYTCKVLIPNETFQCGHTVGNDKYSLVLKWKPIQKELIELMESEKYISEMSFL